MTATTQESTLSQWFDELVASIRTHEVLLETRTADEETKSFYDIIMGGNADEIAYMSQGSSQKHFVVQVVLRYLSLVRNTMPLKLALDISGQEVLVWAEIDDNNGQLEHILIMAEAKVNAEFHKFGYDVTTTIVEKSEFLSVPNHYSLFKS